MIFGERSTVGSEKSFSSSDLLQYAESLIREARLQERRCQDKTNNYTWLKSKPLHNECLIENDLDELRPMVQKMTPENCTAVAVKLDILTEEANVSSTDIIITLKKLLQEQDSMQEMDRIVKRVKQRKRVNKVHPELEPGRQATVSFIVEQEILEFYD